ncbi:MAG: HD domain-containing protein [Patescibacteria group bacterium]|nr:HD domain-containing protein [Patescibacteria group bacterium]
MININDRVYGRNIIQESVLIELINTSPIQRLKGINQAGASQYAIEGKTVTRYEHSLGVMILLKKLGASIEEQIAGLLHDISHTAFSHVIDFVFRDTNYNHEFHEKFHEQIILQSEIPTILKKFNFDIDRILDEHNFSLLEKFLPDLCADRIDYTLRGMVASEGFSDKINNYISCFMVQNNEIIIHGELIAKSFSEDYLRMDEEKCSHPLEVALFQILADAIKIALDKKILNEKGLFEDDLSVYTKLKESGNQLILNKLEMLNPKLKIIDDPNDFHFHSRNKLRYINPKFLDSNGSIHRVAERFKDFSDKLVKHEEKIKKGIFVRIISY